MRQSWRDLLFAHWAVPASLLRRFVPATLEVQEFDGTSWIGLVPFRMTGVMLRPLPDLPWISAFPEMNVRIYVQHAGKPGVWFLSLDASNPIAVWAARRFFHLPYFRARMSLEMEGDQLRYRSERQAARFVAYYRPTSAPFAAVAGSLEHWLTERYCLFVSAPDGTLWRADVHHVPWSLQTAELSIDVNTMFESHGLDVTGPPRLLHFARRQDVVVWSPERGV